MKMRIAGTVSESIVDGPGLRFTVFTQGCPHNCDGCHNPQTHSFSAGTLTNTEDILSKILSNPLLDGVTFSGGEPFCQAEALTILGNEIKKHNLNIITYTGYTFEYLTGNANDNNFYMKLLEITDYLIDGKFEKDKKSLLLSFRGSSNQRIIDCKRSLKEKKIITVDW